MRRFIFNTQGTGISHEQIRRLENTQPGAGTYLESDMSGHPLGDEIMLLDGLHDDMEALQGLGYVGAGNYRSRAVDMNGFALSAADLAASPPSTRRAGRDFRPWGLGAPIRPSQHPNRARADLRTLRPGAGGRSHPTGRRGMRDFRPWGLGESAEVSPYTVDKLTRPDLFIGPNFYPLEGEANAGATLRARRDFRPWGLGAGEEEYANPLPGPGTYLQGFAEPGVRLAELGAGAEDYANPLPAPGTYLTGFGDAAADRRAALATAQSIRNACRAACGLITEANAQQTSQRQSQCRSGCDAAYSAAEAAINGALPPGTAGTTTPEQQAIINAKLDALARANAQAQAGQVPTSSTGGVSNTVLIVGGLAVVGLLAVAIARR